MNIRPFLLALLSWVSCVHPVRSSEIAPSALAGGSDPRVHRYLYNPEEIYPLHGFVGYELQIEFAPDEAFTGLSGGDLEALVYGAHANYLTLKPRAHHVQTNLTVFTNKRRYLFDYLVAPGLPDLRRPDLIYLVHFTYSPDVNGSLASNSIDPIESALAHAHEQRRQNFDYWYDGSQAIKPIAASDDGIHTRLQFAARAEQPAVFVRNEDGTESLLNFNMEQGELVIYRVARRLILRRGKLTGCVINQAFDGGGERLGSGTLSPQVQRESNAPRP